MASTFYVVDAFTDTPFTGNPAAVVPLDGPADKAWMQRLANEMNLSETAFIEPRGERFGLRWFTPRVEVDLCGHATLAAAHVLWETRRLDADAPARFETRSGLLTARRDGALIELDFPADEPAPLPADEAIDKLIDHHALTLAQGGTDLLIELASAKLVRGVRPRLAEIARLPYRGVIVTSVSDDSRYDFVSRFFGPAVGIDEDPVTGSAHCTLAPFWAQRLGKRRILGHQVSSRGGVVSAQLSDDGKRVALGGQAVTVYEAVLRV